MFIRYAEIFGADSVAKLGDHDPVLERCFNHSILGDGRLRKMRKLERVRRRISEIG